MPLPAILFVVLLLATGCSARVGSPPTGSVPSSANTAPSVAPSPAFASASQEADAIPIGDYLPTELDGVDLHTFAVMREITARLVQSVGGKLDLAHASEHGARFIQMVAMRSSRADADKLRFLFAAAAFPPDGGGAEVSELELAGEPVVAVSDPASAARLGTYYLLSRGDVLVVVQSFREADAAAAIAALP
jgi:hypothetical protein